MHKIDWTKWSAVAEILGAFAIVFTLLYLGVQTRYLAEQTEQNNAFLRADAQYRAMQNRLEFATELIRDPVLMTAHEATVAGEEISEEDSGRLRWLYSRMWTSVAWEYQQYHDDLLPNWPIERHREVINWSEIAAETYLQAVDSYREFAPEFYDFIMENSLLPD